MRKLLVLLTVVAVVFIAMNRMRLYIRDPLGAVYKGDVKQSGYWVYINYANDVLVQYDRGVEMQEFLVQGWNRVPGLPAELKCLRALVCLAPSDTAPMVPILGATRATMSSRQVTFTDEAGAPVRVVLR